jgi:AAA15 family ATPase/GTPase
MEPFVHYYRGIMLISFALSNHRSVKDEVVLNLDATNDEHLASTRVVELSGERLLRSALIYGPNGSGKSNLIKALGVMQSIVLSSSIRGDLTSPVNRRIPVEPYQLDTQSARLPSSFHVRFLIDNMVYSYGFEITANEVKSEYLKRKGAGKEATLFDRTGGIIDIGGLFPEGKDRLNFLRPNGLFLSLCAELNGSESLKVTQWFQRLTFFGRNANDQHLHETYEMMRNAESAGVLSDLARQADFGIDQLQLRESNVPAIKFPEGFPQELKERQARRFALINTDISTFHKRYDQSGNPAGAAQLSMRHHASDGTVRFLTMVAPFIGSIKKNAILLVDEIEAGLHPILMRTLFEWFHQQAIGSQAQLIACTHDVLLMDPGLIRRDQIWLVEKDDRGATGLTCLAEFDASDVRPTTKFGRQYLMGVFGAIPHPDFLKADH